MIERRSPLNMVEPRAEVEMKEKLHFAKCRHCGKIIADDTLPLEVKTLKPEGVRALRIKCRNCGKMNFVSHA